MKVIAVAARKGGVAKTTTACNLAWFLAERFRVLFIDLDAQANASFTLEDHASTVSAFDLFGEGVSVPPVGQLTLAAGQPDLDYLAQDRSVIEAFAANVRAMSAAYDVVVIDTPPSLGVSTYAALLAADQVISPVDMGDYSIEGIKGTLQAIRGVSETFGGDAPEFMGLLPSKLDRRSPADKAALEQLVTTVGKIVFPAVVSKRDAYALSASEKRPVWKMRESSAAREAGKEIRAVMQQIEERMGL